MNAIREVRVYAICNWDYFNIPIFDVYSMIAFILIIIRDSRVYAIYFYTNDDNIMLG